MKYLCLIYFDEQRLDRLPGDESEALRLEAQAHTAALEQDGRFLAADALESSAAAVTLRKRRGAVAITSGPFAETREQLGALLLIDAPNLDAAIKVAAGVPAARFGSVEVRPIKRD